MQTNCQHDVSALRSNRQLRVGELVKRGLVEIFSKGKVFDASLKDASIIISEVRMSEDLRHATVFVLPMSGARISAKNKEFLIDMDRISYRLRSMLNRIVHLKYSPELHFRYDESFDVANNIESIINRLS